MKRNNVDGFDKRKAFAPQQRDQLIDSVKAGDGKKSVRHARHLAHSWRRMCCAWLGVAHDFAEMNQ